MDKQQLIVRREKAQMSFDDFAKQRDAKQLEMNDIEAELNRLQGEYRILTEQIEILESANTSGKKKSKVSPEANILNVDEGDQNG